MKKYNLIFVAMIFAVVSTFAMEKVTTSSVDWPEFLAKQDLVWKKFTDDYYTGSIMGNGLVGLNLYKEKDSYKFHIGRVDVTESRSRLNYEDYDNLYHGARLATGQFLLSPVGKVKKEKARLSLWDAKTDGQIKTSLGELNFQTFTHAKENIIYLEVESTGDEKDFVWEYRPSPARSPRLLHSPHVTKVPQSYLDLENPAGEFIEDNNMNFYIQDLAGGKTYVVAWLEEQAQNKRKFWITIAFEATRGLALDAAKASIDNARAQAFADFLKSHTDWWNNFYPAMYLSIPNKKAEQFYWMQHYKLACLTRPELFPIDLQGPWAIELTPWPGIWNNLNSQLTYAWTFAANRAEYSLPLWQSLKDNKQQLIDNVMVEEWKKDSAAIGRSTTYDFYAPLDPNIEDKNLYEVGNLTWLLFHYYEYCNFTGNEKELVEEVFPLLKRAINYYYHIREERSDGLYHLPVTGSPEYGNAKDCNYDLSLLNWGLNALLEINNKYDLADEKAEMWQDFKNKLVPHPQDKDGFLIGEDLKYTFSHRHYSHLMMIYPLYTMNWDQLENRDLIEKSVAHWQSKKIYLQGYSFTSSASIYAMMGKGDLANKQMKKLLNYFIQPNTLYRENGPVIETPLDGAGSFQDFYLQSWGKRIRVFPAVPKKWKDASFINLRTNGAFLVSAFREKGKTTLIQVESEKGNPCIIETGMNAENIEVLDSEGVSHPFVLLDSEKGIIEIDIEAGEFVFIEDRG